VTLAREVRKLVRLAEQRSAFAREWRHRHLAHSELELKLDHAAATRYHLQP
jgi:hypothetical protein